MACPRVIPLEEFVELNQALDSSPVISFNLEQVRNFLRDRWLVMGPPRSGAGITITPVPGQPDCYFGFPVCFGGGPLRMILRGWACADVGDGDCGGAYRFDESGPLGSFDSCTGDCQQGSCEGSLFAYGLGSYAGGCSCTIEDRVLGGIIFPQFGPQLGQTA